MDCIMLLALRDWFGRSWWMDERLGVLRSSGSHGCRLLLLFPLLPLLSHDKSQRGSAVLKCT